MSNSNVMLDVPNLVKHMKSKGILFSIENEQAATAHLCSHNNYFKLTAYRKNYTKYTSGPNLGKYENLEFAYLIELARLDTEVRHLILQMTLDIEHFVKVALINAAESNMANGEDGYRIVTGYLSADEIIFDPKNPTERQTKSAKRNAIYSDMISKSTKNPYCRDLIAKFQYKMPIWAFVELCSFGDLIEIARYYEKKNMWAPPVDIRSLDRVRQLRNACAHGNCIINDMNTYSSKNPGTSLYPNYISRFLFRAQIAPSQRKKKMSNPRINQIVNVLFIYDEVTKGTNTRQLRLGQLHELIDNRMLVHSDFFKKNQLLTTTYHFFKSVSDTLK